MPLFQQSPGVNISEIDLTGSIQTLGISIGAYADNFRWGPINEIVTISDEGELVTTFGKPDGNTAISFFTAANFLAYTNKLKIVRAGNLSQAKNATSNSSVQITIPNDISFTQQVITDEIRINSGPFIAKYPGTMGNSLKYSMCDANSSLFSTWQYASLFTDAPGTSEHVAIRGGANDEIHLVVIDDQGLFSGTPGTILEKYSNLSRSTLAKNGSGKSIYYQSVINESSKYIRSIADPIRPRPIANISFSSGAYSNAGNVFLTFSGGGIEYIKASAQVFCNSQSNAINQIFVYDEGLYARPPQVSSLIAPNGSVSATFTLNLYPQYVSTTPSFATNGGINWDIQDFSFIKTSNVLSTITDSFFSSFISSDVAGTFRGLQWQPDGSQFYVFEPLAVRHFKVSQPWNMDTKNRIVYINSNLFPIDINLANTTVNPNFTAGFTPNWGSFKFGQNGERLYGLEITGRRVYEYNFANVAFNLVAVNCPTNAFYNVSTQLTIPLALTFKPDGTQMYVAGQDNDRIHQYGLSTPWQVNTASFVRSSGLITSTPFTTSDVGISSIDFVNNGSIIVIVDNQTTAVNDKIFMYRLTEAWNVATIVLPPVSNLRILGAGTSDPVANDFQEIYISPDQDRIYVLNDANDTIHQFNLSIDDSNYSSNSSRNYYTNKPVTITLGGGTDSTLNQANIVTAYSYFNNSEDVDIGLVLTGNHTTEVKNSLIESLISRREDCVLFVSPKLSDVSSGDGQEFSLISETRRQITNSSYVVMDSGWKYQYDKYNDTYRWIPLNADIAGICAKTSFDYQDWFSPGGLKRGVIKNIERLAYNPKKNERDFLYDKQVNPVIKFEDIGFVLYGDKTLSRRETAFDRINVRRLFISLKKTISNASRFYLFEFNDEVTRRQIVGIIEPYLRDVQGRRGITDFRVVCDETNNTSDIIDSNQFAVDIWVKPNKSINYIQLNFVVAKTNVSLTELVID